MADRYAGRARRDYSGEYLGSGTVDITDGVPRPTAAASASSRRMAALACGRKPGRNSGAGNKDAGLRLAVSSVTASSLEHRLWGKVSLPLPPTRPAPSSISVGALKLGLGPSASTAEAAVTKIECERHWIRRMASAHSCCQFSGKGTEPFPFSDFTMDSSTGSADLNRATNPISR